MRAARFTAAVLATSIFLMVTGGAAQAGGPTITGAGSTWVAIILDQWRVDVAQQGLTVNYAPIGSTAGRQFFAQNQVDFAASEIPFLSTDPANHRAYHYIPDVAGGTAFMYNLHSASGVRITNLQLSAATAAGIFTGAITNWNDHRIAADNPGLRLASQAIIPVIRSDGSGTSAKIGDYFAAMAPQVWRPFAAANPSMTMPVQFWPAFPGSISQKGSDGVANFVSSDSIGKGSIGYVEAGYALKRGFPVAYLKNKSGHYALPSSANVSTALTHATLNSDLTQNLGGVYNAPEASAYPLASYSYLIAPTKGFDPAKGAVLGAFILYAVCGGQQWAESLGYSPLTQNLVQDAFNVVTQIPGAPKPPSMAKCDNPALPGHTSHHPSGGFSDAPAPAGGQAGGSGSDGTATGDPSVAATSDYTSTDGTLPSASPTPASTLTADERQVRFLAAQQQIADAPSVNVLPFVLPVIGVLLLAFGPFVVGRVRRARGRS